MKFRPKHWVFGDWNCFIFSHLELRIFCTKHLDCPLHDPICVESTFYSNRNPAFFNERLQKSVITSYVFAFIGLYFQVNDRTGLNKSSWKGEVSAVLAGVFYSAYTLLSKGPGLHIAKFSTAPIKTI